MKIKSVTADAGFNKSDACSRIQEMAEIWICDQYSIDGRFIAKRSDDGRYQILSATINLIPFPLTGENNFEQLVGDLLVGQWSKSNLPKKTLLKIIRETFLGQVNVGDKELVLAKTKNFDFYSESLRRDLWFYELHLRITGDAFHLPAYVDTLNLDNALRSAPVPFDGIADLASWLGVADPTQGQDHPSIVFRMNPPADLSMATCKLTNGVLDLTMFALPKLNTNKISIATRSVPGKGLAARRQVATFFKWSRVKNGIRVGKASIPVDGADQVLVAVVIDEVVVRRHWFVDATRARNQRLIAVQQFDADLRMVKRELFNPSTSDKFELAVASLLYVLGFNPVVQIETDSPDLVVMTPEGRLAIVECTIRIADSASKIGKLVDRRSALLKALSANEHSVRVSGVLVCALPKDQMAISDAELTRNRIILVCKDDLASAFDRLRNPRSPDQSLLDAEAKFESLGEFSV